MLKNFVIGSILLLFFCKSSFSQAVKINKLSNNKETYEKMEMLFGNYKIYTHRPGGIKIKRLSDNKQLVVFSDKFKIKFYNEGDKIFDFILDEKKENISVRYNDIELFSWKGKYVPRHQAYFFQILTYDNKPFHYYIKLIGGKPSVALNMQKFDTKIAKAVSKAKTRIAAKYNITPEQIDLILKKRQRTVDKKIEKIVGEEKKVIEKTMDNKIQKVIDNSLQASINSELASQIEDTIGQEIAKEFDSILIDGMEQEFASIVDDAIQEAINEGISEATAEAAIRAIMDVLAAGGTEEEAMAACKAIAGDAC
tara:strand:- start:44 stop:973 length:930 start_codon:yes stop_codon:yes gene_type:complete